MKNLFTKKAKIVITFDKHNLADAKIINANRDQIISASNLLISDCIKPRATKTSRTLTVQPTKKNATYGKNKGFMFKLKRCFLRLAREIFKKNIYKTTVLLNSLYR